MTVTSRKSGSGCLGAFLFIAIIVSLILYSAGVFASHSQPSFDINASSISLTSPLGKPVEFTLTGTSINANWASQTGLSLRLIPSWAAGLTFVVAPAKPDTWGNNITVCPGGCGNLNPDQFTIPVKFALPAWIAKAGEQTLTGAITGDFSSPQYTGGGSSFENDDIQLSIPFTLKLTGK
jgi:hypothetical protein